MATQEDKFNKKRLRSSYFSVVVSITLVLTMLGIVGFFLLNAQRLKEYVQENIQISLYVKDNVKEVDIEKLRKSLDATPYVKSSNYIDKEEAARIVTEDLGEDFVSFLGYNPLLPSIDVYLNAPYAHPDSIAWIVAELKESNKIKEVAYQPDLIALVDANTRKITFILTFFSALLLVIAIALINNSIRLAIYSKRLIIKSMQLVGATQGFIRRPFVWRGIWHGIFSALLAIAFLIGMIYYAQQEMPEFFELDDLQLFGQLFGIVLFLGIFISWISTSLAVRKFMRMKNDQLY